MKYSLSTLTQIAIMTTIIIILGFIPPLSLGFIPVPIIVQNIGVMLAPLILGWKKGTLSVALFLLMCIGLPLLPGENGGLHIFFDPSSGYLYGWLPAAFLIGATIHHFKIHSKWIIFLVVWIWGVFLIDVSGALWLAWYTHVKTTTALFSGMVFIPGDTLKAFIATLVGPYVHQILIHEGIKI